MEPFQLGFRLNLVPHDAKRTKVADEHEADVRAIQPILSVAHRLDFVARRVSLTFGTDLTSTSNTTYWPSKQHMPNFLAARRNRLSLAIFNV